MSTSKPTSTSSVPNPQATKRLLTELQNYSRDPNPALLQLGPIDPSQLLHWEAIMKGPLHGAYENGCWKLDIQVPENYPMQPPAVRFVTRCCHPNVDVKTGEICLDLLKSAWTPAYTISSTLSEVHRLLSYPEPDSPLNVDVAVLMRNGDLVGAESLIRWFCGEWRWDGR